MTLNFTRSCHPLLEKLKGTVTTRHRYNFEEVTEDSIGFKMINENATEVKCCRRVNYCQMAGRVNYCYIAGRVNIAATWAGRVNYCHTTGMVNYCYIAGRVNYCHCMTARLITALAT